MNEKEYNRQSARLKNFDYSQRGMYSITICTQGRQCFFGEVKNGEMVLNNIGEIINRCWREIPNYYQGTGIGVFQIMPNHLHGIIEINHKPDVGAIHELPLQIKRRNMLIPKIIGRFKMNTAKRINILRRTPGCQFWQRNYYEHIVRDDDDLNRIRAYIRENPLNWGKDKNNPHNL